jgi:hypothetical protein
MRSEGRLSRKQASGLAIVARGTASLTVAELADVRMRAIERFSASLRPQLLKHSDEQTLAAAVALDRAIAQMETGEHNLDFSRWAIVSATRYLGRAAFATVIDKYKIDGPWGVSVQVIPHTSPHALASSLSLAIASHGPCLGAGASPGEETEAILTAATLLARPEVAGAWLVISGWSDTTPGPSRSGADTRCLAAVLALVPPSSVDAIPPVGQVCIRPAAVQSAVNPSSDRMPADLLEWLVAGCGRGGALIAQMIRGGLELQIELEGVSPAAVSPAPRFKQHQAASTPRAGRSAASVPIS